MATMSNAEWKKCTDPDKYKWTYINEYYSEPDERFWASPQWIEDQESPGYYWFRCPNGQTLKIKNGRLNSVKFCSPSCKHYMRAVVTKYTRHAHENADEDLKHILKYHVKDLFKLQSHGPAETNRNNFRE